MLKKATLTLLLCLPMLGLGRTAVAAAEDGANLADRVKALEEKLSSGDAGLSSYGVQIHGLLLSSYLFNFNEPDSDTNSLRSLDPDHNSLELDLFQLALSRTSDSGVGFATKLDFGNQAELIASDWNGDGVLDSAEETNKFELQEAYATYTVPVGSGIDLKAGKFVTLLGAEVIEATSNPNISRSFLFGFAIPFTHTGFLASYSLGEMVSITGGLVNGWDNVKDSNDGKSFLGSLAITPCERFSISFNGIIGAEQPDRGDSKRGVFDVVASLNAFEGLDFLLNYDYGSESNLVLVEGGPEDTATWQGFAGIIELTTFDPFTLAFRGEWFEDNDGTRTGTAQDLWEVTVTGEYQFSKGLAGRIEYRHDESSEDTFERFGGLADSQDTVGAEISYAF